MTERVSSDKLAAHVQRETERRSGYTVTGGGEVMAQAFVDAADRFAAFLARLAGILSGIHGDNVLP